MTVIRRSMRVRTNGVRSTVVGLAALVMLGLSAPAYAAEGSIDHVEPGETVQVLFSLPGADEQPALETLSVSLNDVAVDAEAEIASDAETTVRRTTVLAIDVSNSMRQDNRFEEAQAAAKAFLDTAPEDLYVGIVTFASDVNVAQQPSLDRAASAEIIDGLSLSRQTRLYDGLVRAVSTTGGEGSRSVLVLSDGKDTSDTPIDDVTEAIEAAEVKVDVIALSQSADEQALLEPLASAGNGSVISADDPEGLTAVFAAEAESLANQVLISFERPAELASVDEGSLSVSIEAAGETYTDSAFVTLGQDEAPTGPSPTDLAPVEPKVFAVPPAVMIASLIGIGFGILVLLLGVLGVFSPKGDSVQDRIAAYTGKGSKKLGRVGAPQQAPQGMTAQAVGMAEKALESNKGFSNKVAGKLEAAGMAIKPAEWLLAHGSLAILTAIVCVLLSSGNVFVGLGGFAFGVIGPWIFLSIKQSMRIRAFKSQLAETLQLMSGSLAAGLSLAQSVDTVVREGADPIAPEFRRALVEARLGVDIEEALMGVAERMQSKDFEWVVMAIKIQREVGGNLSELLDKVAETIREREYLERQVLALSAEGRLSVWILGGLPPGFLLYLMMANPGYLDPMISTMIGFIMLGVMGLLLIVGIFWMKKLVKVDV